MEQNSPDPVFEWKKYKKIALLGWSFVLICTLAIYDALLFSSVNKEIWNNIQASAKITASHTAMHISTGLLFGKKIEKFQGLREFLQTIHTASDIPVAVFDKNGNLIENAGDFSSFPVTRPNKQQTNDNSFILQEHGNAKSISVPLCYRDGILAGYVLAFIDNAVQKDKLHQIIADQIFKQVLIGAAGFFLLFLLILLWQITGVNSGNPRKTTKIIQINCIIVFLFVMLCNGAFALQTLSRHYTENLRSDAHKTGLLVTDTLKRLLLVGISFDNMDQLNSYLGTIAQTHNGNIALSLINPRGERIARSTKKDTLLLDNPELFPLSNSALTQDNTANWFLQISLVHSKWFNYIKATFLNLVTMVAVSLIFMIELFLLLIRGTEFSERKKHAAFAPHETAKQSSLLRPLTFFMIFATDMTISFIPLRMEELVSHTVLSKEMLLGLPISAEMGMTGLSVLLAGYWIKKQGAKIPFSIGFLMLTLGYLGSMLAQEPWHFILARGVVGAGYGLALLTAQAYTVKDGMLADMFAGVYAGSLCGSAMGAMLAEQFGYNSVFLLSALILIFLVPIPYFLLKENNAEKTEQENTKITLKQIYSLLKDKCFLAFILLCLIPSAVLTIGFLNFFLPVYLKNAGISQSDIGRIYMLNCLIVIYSGPLFSNIVMKIQSKAGLVCLAGIISSFALLALAVFPPLLATVLGSILIGLATGLNIPAQSEYLLQLDIAKAIGIEQSMSLLDAFQRIGQVLGPIFASIAFASMDTDQASWGAGLGIIGISVLFLIIAKPQKIN